MTATGSSGGYGASFLPVRGLAASVVVAFSICGVVLGAGWVIPAGILPPPARAERVAADAAAWLLRYRVVESSLRVEGRRVSGFCLRGWFDSRDAVLARGVLLVLGDGTRILDAGGAERTTHPPDVKPWPSPILLVLLAGCPGIVGKRLAAGAVDGTVTEARAFAAGQPALALHLPPQRDRLGRMRVRDRLTVYVGARRYRPLAVVASLGDRSGTARIRVVRAGASLLERFEMTSPRMPGTRP
jgi:hypothetical protein